MEMQSLKKINPDKLREIAAEILPKDYKSSLRLVSCDEEAKEWTWIVPSYTSSTKEYKVQIKRVGNHENPLQGWWAWCPCRGMAAKKDATGEVNPCRHITAAIFAALDLPLPEPEPKAKPSPKSKAKVERLVFWPSSVARIEACPASASKDTSLLVETTGEAAKVGHAVHRALAELLITGEKPSVSRLLLEEGLPESLHDDVERLIDAGKWAWTGTKTHPGFGAAPWGNPEVELRLEHSVRMKNPHTGNPAVVEFHGRADVMKVVGDEARIIDWKTGRKTDESLYMPQMMAMAMLAFANHREIEKATVVLVWLREWEYSAATITRDAAREWLRQFLKYSAFWDGKTYKPGSHCLYCPRAYECAARREMLRSAVQVFTGADSASILYDSSGKLRPAEEVFRLYEAARTVSSTARQVLGMLKDAVEQAGPIEHDGKLLTIVESAPPVEIDFTTAKPVLEKEVGAEYTEALAVSTSKLKKLVMAQAESGSKKKRWEEVLTVLKQEGAVSEGTPRRTLKIVKKED